MQRGAVEIVYFLPIHHSEFNTDLMKMISSFPNLLSKHRTEEWILAVQFTEIDRNRLFRSSVWVKCLLEEVQDHGASVLFDVDVGESG